MKKALEVLEIMNFTPQERDCYEGQLKWMRMEASALDKAEEKGMEKGMEKGIELGKEQGIEIGEARGETRAMEKIAIRLLVNKLDFSFISEATGLTIAHITTLQKKMLKLDMVPESE